MASSSTSTGGTAGSCLHKRVSSDAPSSSSSCLHKRVSSRELSGTTKFKKRSAYQRFSHFHLAAEHDTHDPLASPTHVCTACSIEPHRVVAAASAALTHFLALSAQPESLSLTANLAGRREAAAVLLAEALEDRRDPIGRRPRLRSHAHRHA
eukprot:scaffold102430_cov63-Phaeocystis_antarctica.AAC.2